MLIRVRNDHVAGQEESVPGEVAHLCCAVPGRAGHALHPEGDRTE